MEESTPSLSSGPGLCVELARFALGKRVPLEGEWKGGCALLGVLGGNLLVALR